VNKRGSQQKKRENEKHRVNWQQRKDFKIYILFIFRAKKKKVDNSYLEQQEQREQGVSERTNRTKSFKGNEELQEVRFMH